MIKIFCNDKLKSTLKDNNITEYTPAYMGESVGLDLYNSSDDIIIPAIEENKSNSQYPVLISTGLHVIVPKGYVALVKERGSVVKTTFKVRAGVIDPGYTGEVFVNLINVSNKDQKIISGKKLPVQLVVVKCDNHFEEITEEEYLNLTLKDLRKSGQIGSSD